MLHQNLPSATSAYPSGIDVYHGNGPVDWAKVRGAGYSFAFIKASEGAGTGGKDSRFKTNMADAKTAGILRGAYHFLRPTQSVKDQVKRFFEQYQPQPGDLLPSLDVDTRDGVDNKTLRSVVAQWLQLVEAKIGVPIVVYANYDIGKDLTNVATRPLWLASPNPTPHVPAPWNGNWTFWQYDMDGHPPGTTGGKIDLDKFNGSEKDLANFCLK